MYQLKLDYGTCPKLRTVKHISAPKVDTYLNNCLVMTKNSYINLYMFILS